MTQRDTRKYLFDILQACELLIQFVSNKSFEDYNSDPLLRSGVERQFEIIGEAINKALKYDPSLVNRISDTKRIIAFRNQLIHGYESIADDIVWGIIETNLPVLHVEVKTLLAEIDDL
jgi:uncharacterized protein with HEPN domain